MRTNDFLELDKKLHAAGIRPLVVKGIILHLRLWRFANAYCNLYQGGTIVNMAKLRHILVKSDTVNDRIFKILFLLVLGIYIVVNVWANLKNITYKPFILIFGMFSVFIIILFKASKRIRSEKSAIIILLAICTLILVGWNLICRPTPVSDYRVIWEGAHQIINGKFYERALDKSDYFAFYNFQIPYTYYISLLLRIHDSIITLKIVEIITLVLTNMLLYKILRLFCKISESFFGATLLAFFSYFFIGSGIINNHHIGMLLGALAVYIIIKRNNYSKFVLSALILGVGNLLRPTIVVIFISIAFVLLIQGFTERKKLFGLLIFVFVYIGFNELMNLVFIGLSLAPYGIKGSDMYFKFLLGLTGSGLTQTPTTDAEHTFLFYDLQYYHFDYEKYKEASREYLFNIISTRQLDYHYIVTKIKTFISGIDNQYMYGDVVFNDNHKLLMECCNFWGVFVYITTIAGAFVQTLKQKIIVNNNAYLISSIAFCAYFGVYIFIEVQTRYRYEQYFFLFIISTPMLYAILNKLDKLITYNPFTTKRVSAK